MTLDDWDVLNPIFFHCSARLDTYYDINYQLKKNGLVKNGLVKNGPNLKNRPCGSKLGPSPNCYLCLGILVAIICIKTKYFWKYFFSQSCLCQKGK